MKYTLCDLINGPLETFDTADAATKALEDAIESAIDCNLENVGPDMGYQTQEAAIQAAHDFYNIIEESKTCL